MLRAQLQPPRPGRSIFIEFMQELPDFPMRFAAGRRSAIGRFFSIPQPFVHDVEQRLAFPKPLKLGNEQLHGLFQPVGRIVGAVRRK